MTTPKTDTRCPYPKTIEDEASGVVVSNDLYKAWHEGYEAHKFEMAELMKKLEALANEMDVSVREVNQIKKKLRERKNEYGFNFSQSTRRC